MSRPGNLQDSGVCNFPRPCSVHHCFSDMHKGCSVYRATAPIRYFNVALPVKFKTSLNFKTLKVSADHSTKGWHYVRWHCCLFRKTKAQTAQNIFTANHVLPQWAASKHFICFFFLWTFVDEIWDLSLSDLMTAAARANYCVFLSFITTTTVIVSVNIDGITPCVAETYTYHENIFRTEKPVRNCLYIWDEYLVVKSSNRWYTIIYIKKDLTRLLLQLLLYDLKLWHSKVICHQKAETKVF